MKRKHPSKERRGAVAVEAAMVLTVLIILMLGLWEVGRLVQINQVMVNAAREGARLAAGGYVDGTPVTQDMVEDAVRDYLNSAGFPTAAVNGAQIALTCNASPSWVNPADAQPLDKFAVQVTIPSGTAFNSLRWSLLSSLTSTQQMSVTVNWQSLNDSEITVPTNLPY
jgi:Flp pilus assembly protein TadG